MDRLRPALTRPGRIPSIASLLDSVSRQGYSLREQLCLILSHRASVPPVKVLGFEVDYLNVHAFRIALGEIFFKGDYQFEAGTDSPVIFDCGANIGLATLFFKYRYPRARIAAFEGNPETAAVLRRNVEQNHLRNVDVYNVLLMNSESEQSFYIPNDHAENLKTSAYPGRVADTREIKLRAAKLSRFITAPVDLLKMDVEGAESEIMTDLQETGKLSLIRRMIIEYHHKIGNAPARLSQFLQTIEASGFEYQLSAKCDPITREGFTQDVLIGAYRSHR